MSHGRNRPAYPSRQLPNDHVPAQLTGDRLDREVDRRRERDFRENEPPERRSRSDSLEKNLDHGPDPQNRRNDYNDRQRHDDDRRYDDRDRRYDDRDRRYDDRNRRHDDNDRRYDDRDRGYDDRDRRYDDRDRRYEEEDRRYYDRDRRYDDRDRRYDDRGPIEADRFMETRAEPRHPQVRTASTQRYMPPYHKKIAIVCSVVSIVMAFFFIGLGVVTAVVRYFIESLIPFVGGLACIAQAVFGFHSSRRQTPNFMNAVTTVATICGIIFWGVFGVFAYWAGRFLGDPGFQYQYRRPDLGYIAVAGTCVAVFALISSMVQIWIACGVTCCAEAPREKIHKVHKDEAPDQGQTTV